MIVRILMLGYCILFFNNTFSQHKKFTTYVNPLIGSADHGHVFVGATTPFGMVQLGPNNLSIGWDWSSGYNYIDSTIIGFTHTHLSGTGIGDMGDILFMPVNRNVKLYKGNLNNYSEGYVSRFKHENEIVKPGYYGVLLDKYNIKAELTATDRVGMHRYTYPLGNKINQLIIDLGEGIPLGFGGKLDTTTSSYIKQIDSVTLEGYRFSKGWAKDEKIFFTAKFSQPFSFAQLWCDSLNTIDHKAQGKVVKALLDFGQLANYQIIVKVGISYVSSDNAKQNLEHEIPHWDFDKVVLNTTSLWDSALSKIKVSISDTPQMKIFYTALYHSMLSPTIFSDVNGAYRGANAKYYDAPHTTYTTFSLWDTYRASHPLFTIIAKNRVSDFVNSFINIYDQQGRLPVWHLVGNETDCMVGCHAIPIIVDAYFKGIGGFDIQRAYKAIKDYKNIQLRGLPYIKQYGYIPSDLETESVAAALEFFIDDWCIAQMAKSLGYIHDYNEFSNRAKGYKHYFDTSILFVRPKLSNGLFKPNFDPFHYNIADADDFLEGNAWQYTWSVPQDIKGLKKLYPNEQQFVDRLDTLFETHSIVSGGGSLDMTGMIGQYVHGNEPSHHIAYLYAYAGQQWKTAKRVRQIMNDFYKDTPSGLCGNDDGGQMSAWYVFSALGFYPVNPINGLFIIGSPLINKAEINIQGNPFYIEVKNNSPQNMYIQSIALNGKNYTQNYITYKNIVAGGKMLINMGNTPNTNFGSGKLDIPYDFKK